MEKNLEFIGEQLKNLTAIPSPSSYTKKAAEYLLTTLKEMGYEPELSNKGNVLVTIGGEGNPLVLASHIDTLGAMVRSIKDNGRLRPTTLGGHQWRTADGENCTIHTRDGRVYTGVVLNTEPSAHVADEKVEQTEENMEILLDENVESKEDAENLGIQVGDIIAMDPRTVITESGYIKSRFLDDKFSTAILLGYAKYLKEKNVKTERTIYVLITSYEEVGHGGCAAIPDGVTDMISVDMGCVGNGLECDETMVSICAKDSMGPYDYQVVSALIKAAQDNDIAFAVDVYPHYGSDVDAALKAGYDMKHGLIGPGVYASHGYERSHRDGAKNTLKLLKAYLG